MTLPIELIDEVIRYLAYNIQSLRRCSLVAKPWVHLCRKWLFQDIVVTRKTHQLWLDSISSRDVELLRNVRSFTYISDPSVWNAITPYRIDSLHRYMHALGRLKFLELSSMFLGPEVLQQIELFSAFQHTLTSLNLTGCCVTSSALVTTINYFPGLVDLNLYSLTHEVDGSLAPPLSRPLRGKLCIGRARTQDRALFNKLSNPPPELDELRFHGVHMPLFYDCILSTHGGSVKRLILEDSCIGGTTPEAFPNLSNCRGLREMEASSLLLEEEGGMSCLASITSTNLRKITVRMGYRHPWVKRRGDDLTSVSSHTMADISLCRLVERLQGFGHKHRLDVVLDIREEHTQEMSVNFEKLLPKFRERGRVEIVAGMSESVVYCSN